MRGKLAILILSGLILFSPLLGKGSVRNFGEPLFWSLLYPVPIPTQFGAYYTLLEDEKTIVPFANIEFGGFCGRRNTFSFSLRPGYAIDKGDKWLRAHAFFLHRWHLTTDEKLPFDHDALILGFGLGGFAVAKTEGDGFQFGPALNVKFAGWTNKISWINDLRGIFELEAILGFFDESKEGIFNKKATGIGATLGFWMPTDWDWLFAD